MTDQTNYQSPFHKSAPNNNLHNNSNNNSQNNKPPNQKYDACFVFEVDKSTSTKSLSARADEVAKKLIPAIGLENMIFYRSIDKGEIILLIRLSEERAAYFADLKNYKFLTNEDKLRERAQLGWPADPIKNSPLISPLPIDMTERPDITRFRPFEDIYLTYEMKQELQVLYRKDPHNETSIFTSTMRLKILYKLLTEPEDSGGLDLKFTKLTTKGPNSEEPVCMAVYALHDPPALAELRNMLSSSRYPWSYNFNMLKDYLGEKSALYYKFVGHYAFWLTGPAVVGLGFEIGVIVTQKTGNASIPFYSLLIVLWGVYMLEYWKRLEKYTALEWGTLGFEAVENVRAEFTDYERVDLTGQQVLYFSPDKKRWRVSISFMIIIILCVVVVGTVALIYIIRGALARSNSTGSQSSAVVASVLNAIQIQVYGLIYSFMAERLNDRENHKTDTQYEDSMIAKNFLFSFVNSYASFFFVAFFANIVQKPTYPGQPPDNNVGMCGYPDCMSALAINLGIVLATGIIVNGTVNVFLPYYSFRNREKSELRRAQGQSTLTQAEREFFMDSYDFKNQINDYMQVAVMFGYMTLFVVALPGSAFVVLLSLMVEVRADAWRITHVTRRPWPSNVEDIGTFQSVLDLMIAAAVVTNGALISFTMPVLDGYSQSVRFWVFIGFMWVVFSAQYVIRAAIPDEPTSVLIQTERTQLYEDKLIKRLIDEDVENSKKEGGDTRIEWVYENIKSKHK